MDATAAEAAAAVRDEQPPELSVIVTVDTCTDGARRSVMDIVAATANVAREVIVATREPWPAAPDGVRVVHTDSPSRGDRLDRATEWARGGLLAFIDSRARLPGEWAEQVLTVLADPAVAIAGGPVLPRSRWRGERITALLLNRQLGTTPRGYVSRVERARTVSELAGSNLVVRREAFISVGGFQSPSSGGEAARLCYKVRALLGGRIVYHPALAVASTARRFPRSFLSDMAGYGRVRGDLCRRCPDVAPLIPYGIPFVLALFFMSELALIGLHRWRYAIIGGAILALAYLVQAANVMFARGRLSDRLLAALSVPLVPLVYSVAFIRGYVGRNLGEISPQPRQRPLRVLIINWRDVTHPWSGGAETYMHEIGKRWAQQGLEVGWLCARPRGHPRVETIDGIRIHRVGRRLTVYLMVPLTYLLRLRTRYDVVIDCENGIPFFTPLFSRLPKVLVMHHLHREIFQQHARPPIRWLGIWLETRIMPRVYRRATVIAVSESTRDDLVDLGFHRGRITVVHNGVYPPIALAREPVARPTLLYLGRLTPQKRVDVLLRALPAVVGVFPDVQLDIIGQGPDRSRLERLVWSLRLARHVRFHGYVSTSMRDELAARAWVSVCPSVLEGWGITCVEASARGLPVIASDVKGLRDSVVDGITGVLVPPDDPAGLAVSLTLLLGDTARRDRMGANGLRWAAAHSWDTAALELRRVLGEVSGATLEHIAVPERLSRVAFESSAALAVADAS